MASSCDQETNRHGPLPTGAWSKPGGVGVGTTAATGIARNLGKMLSGSSRVNTIVLSSGTAMPGHGLRLAGGVLARALDRKERPLPARLGARSERPEDRGPHVAGADRPAVVERGAGPEVEGVHRAGRVGLPAGGEAGLELRLGVELDQVVEQQGHHLAALHVVGERGVERRGIGAHVVGEPPSGRLAAHRAGGDGDQQARQQAQADLTNGEARERMTGGGRDVDMKA